MRDAKSKSEGRPTDSRDRPCRVARPGAHERTAAAVRTRRNERARCVRLSRALRPAIIPFLADGGEYRRGAGTFAADGAPSARPMRAA